MRFDTGTAMRVGITFALLAVVLIALILSAGARDLGQWKYASPDVAGYFATLKQPDAPGISCCGEADAYWADKTEYMPNGALVAVITDTRDDATLQRPHIPPGTRIVVPASKIRRPPTPNPTDHTIIFIGASSNVYCYEPLPGI